MLLRGIVRYQSNGIYDINPEKKALVAYYAKTIEHNFKSDKAPTFPGPRGSLSALKHNEPTSHQI